MYQYALSRTGLCRLQAARTAGELLIQSIGRRHDLRNQLSAPRSLLDDAHLLRVRDLDLDPDHGAGRHIPPPRHIRVRKGPVDHRDHRAAVLRRVRVPDRRAQGHDRAGDQEPAGRPIPDGPVREVGRRAGRPGRADRQGQASCWTPARSPRPSSIRSSRRRWPRASRSPTRGSRTHAGVGSQAPTPALAYGGRTPGPGPGPPRRACRAGCQTARTPAQSAVSAPTPAWA